MTHLMILVAIATWLLDYVVEDRKSKLYRAARAGLILLIVAFGVAAEVRDHDDDREKKEAASERAAANTERGEAARREKELLSRLAVQDAKLTDQGAKISEQDGMLTPIVAEIRRRHPEVGSQKDALALAATELARKFDARVTTVEKRTAPITISEAAKARMMKALDPPPPPGSCIVEILSIESPPVLHFATSLAEVMSDAHWPTQRYAEPMSIGEVVGIQIGAGKQAPRRCLDGIKSALGSIGLKPVITPTEGTKIEVKVGASEESLR